MKKHTKIIKGVYIMKTNKNQLQRFLTALLILTILIVSIPPINTVQATPEPEEMTKLPNRYIIDEFIDGNIQAEAINNITYDNHGIYIEDIARFGIDHLEFNDIIEVEFIDNEIVEVKKLNVLTYKVTTIEYYNQELTDGYLHLEPLSDHKNIVEMTIHMRYNHNSRYHIDEDMGEWMHKYDIDEIEEGDIIQLTIDDNGISRFLTIH